MFFTNLSIRNFKCFQKADISFSKITLLTGENSSGKSSLIHALLSPLQTNGFPFYMSPNGIYVNMGDFLDFSFNRRKNNLIQLSISFDDDEDEITYDTSWFMDPTTSLPKLSKVNYSSKFLRYLISTETRDGPYNIKLSFNKNIYLDSSDFQSDMLALSIIESFEEFMSDAVDENSKESLQVYRSFSEIRNIRKVSLPSLRDIRRVLIKKNHSGSLRKIEQTQADFERINSRFNFLSSFRLPPERAYYRKSITDRKIGILGENCIDQILEWESTRSNKFNDLKSKLRKIGLISSLRSRKLRGGRFELNVKTQTKGIWSSLFDVGFGISQFMPIIVADLQLPSESTLSVSQPEIHLHPQVQASLGDYFIDQISEKSKRYIIETHSEYLINRIRLGIVQGKLTPQDVSIYYFENVLNGCIVHKLLFTESGVIENAPQGFFDTYMIDTMEIALNS